MDDAQGISERRRMIFLPGGEPTRNRRERRLGDDSHYPAHDSAWNEAIDERQEVIERSNYPDYFTTLQRAHPCSDHLLRVQTGESPKRTRIAGKEIDFRSDRARTKRQNAHAGSFD